MKKINILVLAAARRNDSVGDDLYPSCLEEFDGVSLLERIVTQTSQIADAHYAYSFLEDDINKFYLDKISSLLTPNSTSFRISSGCKGAACTALYSACQLEQESELLILSANELVDRLSRCIIRFSYSWSRCRNHNLFFCTP
jgi:hypothetical protein